MDDKDRVILRQLASLIRKGSQISIPTTGIWVEKVMGEWRACALGAAMLASCPLEAREEEDGELVEVSGDWRALELQLLYLKVPYPKKHSRTCRDCQMFGNGSLFNMVIHLNDEHFWPREKIAEYLECLADQDDATSSDPLTISTSSDPLTISTDDIVSLPNKGGPS